MGTSWVIEHSGLVDEAEQAAGQFLTDHFEQPLQSVWHKTADIVDTTRATVSNTVHNVEHTVRHDADKVRAA